MKVDIDYIYLVIILFSKQLFSHLRYSIAGFLYL